MDLLIKNGILVDSAGMYPANLGISNGKISAIFHGNKGKSAEQEIDAKGKLIFPGIIDSHVHFQLQDMGKIISTDSFATGSKAAAFGGVTTFIDFADQTRGESPLKGFHERKRTAEGQVAIDYSLHVSKTDLEYLDELPDLIKEGVNSFKFFTTYSWRNLDLTDAQLVSFFSEVRKQRGFVIGHCENDSMIQYHRQKLIEDNKTDPIFHAHSRPHLVEEEAIQRVILLARRTGVHLHIAHISTKQGSDLLAQAKAENLRVSGESCPQYLLLNEKAYSSPNGYLNLMSPPLRHAKDQQALINHLQIGTFDQIVTDHCEFSRDSKGMGKLPFHQVLNGIPGVETVLPLMHDLLVNSRKISYPQLVQLLSTNPAKIFGLYPRKGSLQIGTDADLVIFDPMLRHGITPQSLHYKIDWNPYTDFQVTGWPITTILRGEILCNNGQFIGQPDGGKYLKREHMNYMKS
ncbi:MAG: dihydropyrimidinase [Candidatus Hodarchaeales archaeon]